MKLPKYRTILGKKWKIRFKWNLRCDDGHKVDGLCDFKNRYIWLDRLLPKDERFQVFLHEEFHAVLHELCFNQLEASSDAQEIVCEGLSRWMVETYDIKFKKKKKLDCAKPNP